MLSLGFRQMSTVKQGSSGSATVTAAPPSEISPLFQAALQEARTGQSSVAVAATNPLSMASAINDAQALGTREAIFQARAEAAKSLPSFRTGNMRVSPQKLNHLARLIRGRTISDAKSQMQFTLKRRGVTVAALLRRVAAALRHNYKLDPDHFIVQQAFVGKGTYLKRIRIHARGRFGVMHHPYAHLKIILGPRKPDGTPLEDEMEKVAFLLRKRKLFTNVHDSKPIQWLHPPWSRKPWKYVRSAKWTNPDAVLAKK
eukprot:jgi/Hompol1/3222/HPOL_006409-RA